MARGLDAGKYFWRSGREKCFSLDIPFYRTSGSRRPGRNFRVARHSEAIGGIRFGFLSRPLIYADCPRGLGFDREETLAVAISPERMWAYSTRFCRKPDNPAFR